MDDNIKLEDFNIRDALLKDFWDIIKKYKEEYQNKIDSAKTESLMIQTANEYLKQIEEGMDSAISKRLGFLKEEYRFGKKKNKEITSLQGNIFS